MNRYSDAYHTCYVLSGLSSAQHKWKFVAARPVNTPGGTDTWQATPYTEEEQIFEEDDRVGTTHPVYVIPQHTVEEAQQYFAAKVGF
jgi:protein farnesyltransferase subunit beta